MTRAPAFPQSEQGACRSAQSAEAPQGPGGQKLPQGCTWDPAVTMTAEQLPPSSSMNAQRVNLAS